MSHGIGPDDLLARDGAEALTKVLAEAMPADPDLHLQALLGHAPEPLHALGKFIADKAALEAVNERGDGCRLKVTAAFRRHRSKALLDNALDGVKRELMEQDAQGRPLRTNAPIYSVTGGALQMQHGDGSPQHLANFDAHIAVEHIDDDGVQQQRSFEIEGTTATGEVLPRIHVSTSDYGKVPWWLDHWGARAIAAAGRTSQEHLRTAIQTRSTPERRTRYSHTGWRSLNSGWCYLHGDGAIGAAGIDVALQGSLSRIVLPNEPQALREAMQLVFKIRDMAPRQVSVPLLLAAFRAPLLEVLPIDGAIHLAGRTGTLKSSAAAIVQSLFGAGFTHATLPASFADTFASLEHKCHVAKDAVVVIDEYVPSPDPRDDVRKKMSQLVRMIGNGAPRGRMSADLAARPSRPPRALIITTGEEVPDGESTVARQLVVGFDSSTINRQVLSELQASQHRLPHALAGYLGFLAPRLDSMRTWAMRRHLELRSKFSSRGGHLRAPSMAAHLALAADVLSEYVLELGVFDSNSARAFVEEAHTGLAESMQVQTAETRQENPGRRFLHLLGELLASGTVRVVPRSQPQLGHQGEASAFLGWQGRSHMWLLPGQTYAAVAEFARRQGHPLPLRERALWRGLRDLGAISAGDDGHLTLQREVQGQRHRVIELHVAALGRADESVVTPAKLVDHTSTDDMETWQGPENDGEGESEHPSHRPPRRWSV